MSDSEEDIRVEGFEDSNDFEIHEHYSDLDHENENPEDSAHTFPEEGFPKVEHRSKSSENFESSHDGDVVMCKPLEEMTDEEVAAAQRQIIDKLGKETCDFLVERRLKQMKEGDKVDGRPPVDQVDEKPAENVTLVHEKVAEKVFPNVLEFKIDEFEALKFEWMQPKAIETSTCSEDEPLMLHQLKFDFLGQPVIDTNQVGSAEDMTNNIHLDPHKLGYTIPELLNMLQSSFKPQVQLAMKTLANIIQNSYSPKESNFGYEPYRWNQYIHEDIDLPGKVGYVACNSKCSATVADAIRCLTLLLFGDLSGDKPVVPIQDLLFPYYMFDLGVKVFHTSPYSLDPFDVKVEHLKFLDSVDINKQNSSLVDFFVKCAKGEFVDVEVGEINQQYRQVLNLQVDALHDQVTMDPLLLCVAKGNLVRRLLWIIYNHKHEFVLVLYSLKLFCGLLCRFKSAVADALVTDAEFVTTIEKFVNTLIKGTVENEECTGYSEDQQRVLTHTLLYMIKYMSVYASNGFHGFCERVSAVALMKQTLRKIYNSVLNKLEQGAQKTDKQEHGLDASWAPLGRVVLNTFTVWALKEYFYDHLVEMLPVLDHEIIHFDSVIRTRGSGPRDEAAVNGGLLAHLLLHIAVCMAKDSSFNFQNCDGSSSGLISLIHHLCFFTMDQCNDVNSILLYSCIKYYSCYVEHCPKKNNSDFYQKQSEITHDIVEFGEKLASVIKTRRLCSTLMEIIKQFDPNWHPSINKPINSDNQLFNRLLDGVVALEVASSVLHLRNISKGETVADNFGNESIWRRLRDKLVGFALSIHKSKNEIKVDQSVLSSANGSTGPMLLLEAWAKYLYRFHLSGTPRCQNEDAMDLVAVLAISCDYDMVTNALTVLHNEFTSLGDSRAKEIAFGFKGFNDLMYLINTSTPNMHLPMVNFVSYLEMAPILALDLNVAPRVHDVFCSCIKGSNTIWNAFLRWSNPFKSLLHLSNVMADDVNTTTFYLFEICQSLVFKRFTRPTMHVFQSPRFLESENMANVVERLVEDCDVASKGFIVYTDDNLAEIKVLVQKLISLFNGTAGDSPLIVALLLMFISSVSHFEIAKLIWRNSNVMLSLSKAVHIDCACLQLIAKASQEHQVSIGSVLNFLPEYNEENTIKGAASALLREFDDDAVAEKNGILVLVVATLFKYSRGDLVTFKNGLAADSDSPDTLYAFIDKVLRMSE